MNQLSPLRAASVLLPLLVVFAIVRIGPEYWPSLTDLQLALATLGLTCSVWIASALLQSWGRATLRVLVSSGFLAVAALSVWPIVRQALYIWNATPYGDAPVPFVAMFERFSDFLTNFQDTLIQYHSWALTLLIPAVGSLLAWGFTTRRFIVQPLKGLMAGNRDVEKGPWSGTWMTSDRVRELTRRQTGVPLGLKGGAIVRYEPDGKHGWLPGHHMVIAGTRAGKGVSCVIPAIIDHDGPVVAIDIKGENFSVCRRYRQSLGRRQIVLNPFHVIEDQTGQFDPLTYLRPGHLQRDIATLCDGLIKPEASADTSWISNAARELLEAAFELVMVTADDADKSLLTVANLVLAPNRLETFTAWMSAGDLCNGRIAQAGAKITQMGDRQQGAVLDCLSENLSWLKFDQVRAMVAASDFYIDDLLDNTVDLYLVVPQDMTDKLANFMRLMMTLTLGAVTRQDGRRQAKAKILAVLDEFTRLGRMEKVLEIATIAAGGGVEAVFVVQDRGTLDKIYTPHGATTLLGSCATTRVFGLGSADDKTAQWVENLLPHKTISRQSRGRGGKPEDINHSETKERLMEGPTLLQLSGKRMLCLFRSNPPLLLEQIVSHTHPAYRQKLDENRVPRV